MRTAVPTRRLWTPSAGQVQVSLSASPDPACMVGVWLVGVEESEQDSGEICIAELFGHAIGANRSIVRLGIKAHHDRRLATDMVDLPVPIDAASRHSYGAAWGDSGVRVLVEGQPVWSSAQRLDYPVQLMIDLFEFPDSDVRDPAHYPKSAIIHRVDGTGEVA